MVLSWWGAVMLLRNLRTSATEFNTAKRIPILALSLSMLMWLIAFLTVGAEWFLMWQSHTWNGQDAAFRMFVVVGIVMLLMLQPDREEQP
jgi:predicted small integral membrane protein